MISRAPIARRPSKGRACVLLVAYVGVAGCVTVIAEFLGGLTASAIMVAVFAIVAAGVLVLLWKQLERPERHGGRRRPLRPAGPAKEEPIDMDPIGEDSGGAGGRPAAGRNHPAGAPAARTAPAVPVQGPPRRPDAAPPLPARQEGAPPSAPPSAAPSPSGRPPRPTEHGLRPSADEFPRPDGSTANASREPWRLPAEPGPAGISADAARLAGLDVRAASVVGPAHRCEDPATPRQDAYRIGVDRSQRYLLIVVADGMADSSHSHIGANVATTAVVRFLWPRLSDMSPEHVDWPDCFTDAARHMVAAAKQRDLDAEAVRAALITAVVEIVPSADGQRRAWLAWIADVSAWSRHETGWRHVAGAVKEGLDRGRLSEFLPFHPQNVRHRLIVLPPDAVLAVASDGVGDVLGRRRIGDWFAQRWAVPPPIGDFIQTVAYDTRGELDDRTAVVVWCGPDRR